MLERPASDPADSPHAATTSRHCDGTSLPACPGGLTGPSCSLACPSSDGAGPRCGFELYCHGDGSVYGLATHGGALLYSAPVDASPSQARAALVEWIASHEQDLGLPPGPDEPGLGLAPAPAPAQPMGGLVIHRFTQTYRSLPVLPPDDVVRVVHTRKGAIQITGRIVDSRIDYEHHAAQASPEHAAESIRYHAHRLTGIPRQDLVVDGLELVAMPEPRAIAWLGHAKHAGGALLARVIVSADPAWSGNALPLVSWRPVAVEDLASTRPIQVFTASPASDPAAPGTSVETTLVHGEPLLGSIDDVSGQVQLATEAVVVLDLHGGSYMDLDMVGTRVLDPHGEFLAGGGAGFQGQMTHHLLHSWYALFDGYLTDPVSGAKRWDSALPAYSPLQSTTPAGTFAPRMLAFTNAASSDCPPTAVACAGIGDYVAGKEDASAFPEVAHHPGGGDPELTGRLSLPSPAEPGHGIIVLAHELGHAVDLFAGPGFTRSLAPDCGDACDFECVEDTSDEAPPLGETIAQMIAMIALHDGFEPVGFEYCEVVAMLSRGNVNAFDPGPCVPEGEDVSVLERAGACSKPDPYCDKPDEPGFWLECCNPVEPGCVVAAPLDCPTGFQRQVPSGLCHHADGYDAHSTLQALWQLLNGRRCEPGAPFTCDVVEWPGGVAPEDVVIPAFLYSLRLDPLSYEQLFDGMATYIACTHGPAAYIEYNEVVCAHGIRACDAPPPAVCEACGNGVREGAETCDGLDWAHTSCEDVEGYDGGELRCDAQTCQLDLGLCWSDDGGLDSTAGTSGSVYGTAGTDPTDDTAPEPDPQQATDTEGDSAGFVPDDGCNCRSTPSPGAPPLTLLALLVGSFFHRTRTRHRHRRSSWPTNARSRSRSSR